MTNGKADDDVEEYLIFARIPEIEDDSLEGITSFLDRLANLLSDEDQHVYVESYMEYDGTQKERKKDKGDRAGGADGEGAGAGGEGAGGGGGGGKENPAGTRKSPLYPMYVCHNKF